MNLIDEKIKILEKYEDAYYNKQPLISDASYDLFKESVLRALPDKHPYRTKVGHAPTTAWPKAKHSIFMGSLNKVSNEEDIGKWIDEVYKNCSQQAGHQAGIHYRSSGGASVRNKLTFTLLQGDGCGDIRVGAAHQRRAGSRRKPPCPGHRFQLQKPCRWSQSRRSSSEAGISHPVR